MGQRGPAPKPDALRLISGGRIRRPSNLSDGVNPPVEVPSMPREFSREARKEWKRITPHLEALGLVSQLDRNVLIDWCRVTGLIEDLEAAWRRRIERLMAELGIDYAEAVERCAIDTTPSGYRQQSALASMLRSLREERMKLAAQFGLSPSARARVMPSRDAGQLGLPGVEDAVANRLAHLRSV
jgi:P27 family predicted phage terminase small subunit